MNEKEMVSIFKAELEKRNIEHFEEVYVKSSIADIVIPSKSIAIEGKLKDLNKAIFQLVSYGFKYDKKFLLMPYSKKNLVNKRKEELVRNGIKWFFIKENGRFSYGHSSWKKTLFE